MLAGLLPADYHHPTTSSPLLHAVMKYHKGECYHEHYKNQADISLLLPAAGFAAAAAAATSSIK
jgi:hypothetical protein